MSVEILSQCLLCGSDQLAVFDAAADLTRCRSCHFVFANPRPTIQALVEYYSKPAKYDGWLAEEKARDDLWQRRVRKMKTHAKPGSLLDVGTGIGQFLAIARSSFSEVDGTEVSASAVRLAKEKYGLIIRQGEAESLDFGRSYDNITLFHVLEHVPDPARLIRKCHSLLVSGGRLFIAVPNDLKCLQLKMKAKLGKTSTPSGIPKIQLDGSVDEIHLSQFTPETLATLLKKNGFEVINLSLDPFFAKSGLKRILHRIHYRIQLIFYFLTRKNIYNTIWAVARKPR